MDIKETSFGPKTYLAIKKSISTDQITDKQMYDEAGNKLGTYMAENGITPAGSWSVLYLTWDEVNKKTDIAIGFPVNASTPTNNPEFSIIQVPESNASLAVLQGDYSALGKTHQALMDYSKHHSFNKDVPVIAIEEYIVNPMQEPDPEKLVTNICYLHN